MTSEAGGTRPYQPLSNWNSGILSLAESYWWLLRETRAEQAVDVPSLQ